MIQNILPPTDLKLSDFNYDLPESYIAQTPAEPRDSSKLMIINRSNPEYTFEHRIFRDILEYLNPEDVLVINDTRVIPARIIGKRLYKMQEDGTRILSEGQGAVELLLLRQRENDVWEALAGPGKRAKPGDILTFGDDLLRGHVLSVGEGGCRMVRLEARGECQTVYEALHLLGSMPLPPYITEQLSDPERYQTVYARNEGSAAAPTAGLHFTPELLDAIRAKGCAIAPVLLHVGLGTFRPVKEERIADHEMHAEFISVSPESAELINTRRKNGGRVIAVGTTSCRVLESASDDNGILHPMDADTGIFIYPGYKFKMVDALITNFHLPESSLLMLVSALADRDRIMAAYTEAKKENYRFFSFGDAMFIC
ncbi:MAG: tRNA preQ1(34) S-adenosylmethionine ribosyltransferase-isomerase QueA [Clostridia bacterium]|nr:tRNA preQ1(34) S-adenosylmethionine ribosyltransferase-isomerase QueA [Clostridia bacterium]